MTAHILFYRHEVCTASSPVDPYWDPFFSSQGVTLVSALLSLGFAPVLRCARRISRLPAVEPLRSAHGIDNTSLRVHRMLAFFHTLRSSHCIRMVTKPLWYISSSASGILSPGLLAAVQISVAVALELSLSPCTLSLLAPHLSPRLPYLSQRSEN